MTERERMASANSSAWVSTSSRRCPHTSVRAASTVRKDGVPARSAGGKYVPPKNGRRSGVRNTLIGHPPEPVTDWTASM